MIVLFVGVQEKKPRREGGRGKGGRVKRVIGEMREKRKIIKEFLRKN